jgi:hypothetical protein
MGVLVAGLKQLEPFDRVVEFPPQAVTHRCQTFLELVQHFVEKILNAVALMSADMLTESLRTIGS